MREQNLNRKYKKVDGHLSARKELKGYEIFKPYHKELTRKKYHKLTNDDVVTMLADCVACGVDEELVGVLVYCVVTHNDAMWEKYIAVSKQ